MDDIKVPSMIAYCGINCATCPIYLAGRETDPDKQANMREGIAATLKARYGMDVAAGQIDDCDGCRSADGKLFFACGGCEIRKCAITKQIESCAFCPNYVCDTLHSLLLTEEGYGREKETLGEDA